MNADDNTMVQITPSLSQKKILVESEASKWQDIEDEQHLRGTKKIKRLINAEGSNRVE